MFAFCAPVCECRQCTQPFGMTTNLKCERAKPPILITANKVSVSMEEAPVLCVIVCTGDGVCATVYTKTTKYIHIRRSIRIHDMCARRHATIHRPATDLFFFLLLFSLLFSVFCIKPCIGWNHFISHRTVDATTSNSPPLHTHLFITRNRKSVFFSILLRARTQFFLKFNDDKTHRKHLFFLFFFSQQKLR